MNAFCRHCGKAISEAAMTCPECGGVQQAAAPLAAKAPDGPLWLPITSLVLGVISALTLLDDSEWSQHEILGVGIIAAFALTLGAISIKEYKTGKGMAIAGVVLACITLNAVLGLYIS